MRALSICVVVTLVSLASACDGGSSSPDASHPSDAATPDAGAQIADGAPPDATVIIGDGVHCGDADDGGFVSCTLPGSIGCCYTKGGIACQPNDNTVCPGFLATCDGPEDCGPGNVCCSDSNGDPTCEAEALCGDGKDDVVICHESTDCPKSSPSCCDGFCGPGCG